jgi:hypothetical protein
MNAMRMFSLIAAAAAILVVSSMCEAGELANRWAARHARSMSWHANYAHTAYGTPLGLVVPPTANMQTKMGWGVAQNEMVPIYHQFHRAYQGGAGGSMGLIRPTPAIPSHTDQFGVYYVRGPW